MIPVRLLLLVTITFWGWSFVAAKICLNYMIPLEIIGLRCLLGLPVLLVIIFLKRLRPRFSLRETGTIVLSAAVITTRLLIQVTGMKYTTAPTPVG